MTLSLSCLGTFTVQHGEQIISHFRSTNVQGLLVYLAMQAERPFPRDVLATLFWPDQPDSTARKNLRQTLYQLRQLLDDNDEKESPFLLTTHRTIQFNPASDYTLDVQQFLAALDEGDLATAVSHYTADLLPGFTCDSLEFEEWLRGERERLNRLALEAMSTLTARHLRNGRIPEAQTLAQRQLTLEPWSETAHQQLMEALALAGNRTAALAQFEQCRAILDEELGISPSPETTALAERIQNNELRPIDPNLIAGRYALGEELGRGAMGIVYRGRDSQTGETVAIKMLDPQRIAGSPLLVERFLREGEALRQLNHPNIVKMLAMDERNGRHHLVMEYSSGGDLRHLLDSQPQLPLERILTIALDLADALTRAHRLNILHRDLKPANVLLDEHGLPRLTDFGLARLGQDSQLTEDGAIMGTFAYLSPEACMGESLDERADIWAFGVLLYEMLAGEQPFTANTPTAILTHILNSPLPDIRPLRPDIPTALESLLYRMLSKERAERIPSVRLVGAELEAILQGSPLASPRPNLPAPAPLDTPQPTPDKVVRETKRPSSHTARNRLAMLQHVRSFWVEGVLENNLHQAALIDLGLKTEWGAVDNPWDTLIRTPAGGETLTDERIIDIFDRLNGKLLILGEPGSGKTTTLLTLARDLLLRAEMDEHHPIPVIFNLSAWGEQQLPLTEWLVEDLNSKYQVPRKIGQQWLENEALLLLLDGLDEVAANARDNCVAAINHYREEYGFVDMVVCSRTADYEALTSRLRLQGAVIIQPLDDEQIADYLYSLGSDVAVVHDLITRDAQLRELAQSPLMLSIMVLAYRGKTASEVPDFADVETQRQNLFQIYVQRVFERRLGEAVFTKADTLHYLQWLARQMQQQAKTVFHIEELQPSVLSPQARRGYILGLRLSNMVMNALLHGFNYWIIASVVPIKVTPFVISNMLIGMLVGWIFTAERKIMSSPWPHILLGLLQALAWGSFILSADGFMRLLISLAGGSNVVFGSLMFTSIYDQTKGNVHQIYTKESIRVSIQGIKPGIVITSFLVTVIPGLVYANWLNPTGGWFAWLLGVSLSGLGFSALATVANSLVSSDIALRITPNQGIQQSLRTAFRLAGIFGSLIFISYILSFPATSLKVATGLGIGFGIEFVWGVFWLFGWFVYVQHHVLRAILHRAGHLPKELVRFLDYAASLILLRKVGGGYIFVHRFLLEYFANLPPAADEGQG